MDLRKRIEENPIISLLLTSFVIVSVVFAIVQYLHSREIELIEKQHKLEVSSLQSRLSSIKRGISDSDYFDVKQLFISKDEINNISQSLKYFEDDEFYAISDPTPFVYSKISALEILEIGKGYKIPEVFREILNKFFIHQWIINEEINIEGIEDLNNITPQITVQKYSKEMLKSMLGDFFHNIASDKKFLNYLFNNELTGSVDTLKVSNNLESMYDGNWSAIFLENYLTKSLQISAFNSNADYKLLNITKVKNLIYAQGLTTLKNVIVNNEKYKSYYLRNEIIITSDSKEVYIISTRVPSSDPSTRNQYFNDVTYWLSNFKMIVDK